MRWRGRQRSDNVEDRRGAGPKRMAAGGGGIGLILVVLIALFFGADPRALIGLLGRAPQIERPGPPPGPATPAVDDEAREFIEVVLHDTEEVWTKLFRDHVEGGGYRKPKLIMFSGSVQSRCGMAGAAMGPFYCPADQQIYIDPMFFEQLKRQHNAPGDFAQAYVIAHEVAHHVQKQVGWSDIVDRIRSRRNTVETNRASVRLELQADYLAGVWAHHAQRNYDILEQGDIREAMNAANQIGDDTLQLEAQGYVVPERFTHGKSEQRVRWFAAGLKTGNFKAAEQLFEIDYGQL